jgi:MtaA/CmuA family methyltransferase
MNYEELLIEMEKYKDTMTDMERGLAYFKGEEVDRIPYTLIDPDTAAPLYGYTIGEYRKSMDVQCDIMEKMKIEFDLSGSEVGLGLKSIGEALGSTVVYPENGMDYVSDFVLKDYSILDTMNIIDPYKDGRLPDLIDKIRFLKNHYPEIIITTDVAGPFTTAASIRKPENVLRDVIKDKENLHRLLDFSVKCSLVWVEAVCKELGPLPVNIGDPVGSLSLINVKQFEEFSKPHLKDLIDGIKDITGFTPSIHICGKTRGIWTHLVEIGIKSLSIDNCEDLEEAKLLVGDKLALAGNVPPVEVMRDGTIDDVIEAVKICLRKGSDNPMGYMLFAGCQVPLGTPRENLHAFAYAAKKYGRGAQRGKLCKGLFD